MFHDVFGHIPLLMDEQYSNFAQKLGEVGVKNIENKEMVLQLQRLYWFTIEFGLKKGKHKTEIYGAGIMSSFGESNYIYEANTKIIPFNFSSVINKEFRTDEIQTLYYEIESYQELFDTLNEFDLNN
jgi:phenylalanine-4-hydroxylase